MFNALIISSLRLDNNTEPEVGASTYSFTATPSTKIYVSRKNIEKANTSLKKKLVYVNQHDYDSQLRQLKSYLTCPNTYVNARVFSKWTDDILCRPFSILNFAEKSGVDQNSDSVVASNVLVKIADAMRFNNGVLKKKMNLMNWLLKSKQL